MDNESLVTLGTAIDKELLKRIETVEEELRQTKISLLELEIDVATSRFDEEIGSEKDKQYVISLNKKLKILKGE